MKLVKAMATVAGLTGLSRLAGFVRDVLSAAILGAGPVADAFFVALKLPNFFRRVTAEGAFSVAFVPVYSEILEKQGEAEADLFASRAFAVMLWVLSGFTALCLMIMPWLLFAIAPGFQDDPVRSALAVELSRITFPYLLLMSLTSLLGGVLNAHHKFAPFAAAPILFNGAMVVSLLINDRLFETPGHAMAWGIFAAGILQLAMLYVFIRRNRIALRMVRPVLDDRIRQVFRLMGPGIIGAGVMHINLFADMIIASFLPTGSISHLYYADRLQQLPLGMIGIAVGTALLPLLSRAVASGQRQEANDLYNRSLEYCFLLGLPAAAGLFTLGVPIVETLFQRGAFTTNDAYTTGLVLMGYAAGLPAYISIKVFASVFWAQKDTMTPVKASVVCTILNVVLCLVFIQFWGVVGIPAATAIAGWVQVTIMYLWVRKVDGYSFDLQFLRHIAWIVIGSLLMVVVVGIASWFLTGLPHWEEKESVRVLGLGVMIGAGGGVYALTIVLSGVIKWSDITGLFKRRKKVVQA